MVGMGPEEVWVGAGDARGGNILEVLKDWMRPERLEQDATRVSLLLRGASANNAVLEFMQDECTRNPASVHAHLFLVQLHTWRGDPLAAESTFMALTATAPDLGVDAIEDSIKDHLNDRTVEVSTKYSGMLGSSVQSLGFYSHSARSGSHEWSFVTKISMRALLGNEPQFYTRILPAWGQLGSVAPTMVRFSSSVVADLCMLTMERIEGCEPDIASMDARLVDVLVRRYAVLTTVDPESVQSQLPRSRSTIDFNHGYLVQAMCRMHEPDRAEAVMVWLERAVCSRGYPDLVQHEVSKLTSLMRSVGFQARIIPSQHFAFLHGDLHRHNIIQRGEDFVFIDWARCATGPACIDLAVLLRRFGFQGTIDCMERNGLWAGLDPVGRALFAYALILVSVMIDIEQIKTEPPEHLFLPAMRFIEGVINS